MNPQTSQQSNYKEWLNWLTQERCISPEVIKESGLYLYREELSIPVRDVEGKLLFYKHRRSFKTDKGIKYRYDKGATAALFGAETLKFIKQGEVVIVVEGELDALAMRTLGYHAVSSTGGAGTWRPEWSTLLAPFDVIFLYDADKAGVEGMLKAAQIHGKIAWCPVEYGKDPTDVIVSGHIDALKQAIADAKRYLIPSQEDTHRLEALKSLQKVLLKERGEKLINPNKTPFHVNLALKWIDSEIDKEKEMMEREIQKIKDEIYNIDVKRARAYPIKNLIKVNRQRKAKCLWHDDKEPSMHVYPDHAYCFVCGKRVNAVDVYMQLNGCDFKTAVAALV